MFREPTIDEKRDWAIKLRKSGFIDLEDYRNPDGPLRSSSTLLTRHWSLSAEDYYRLAGQYLYSRTWDDRVERVIWELHANGATQGMIHRHLRQRLTRLQIRDTYVRGTISKLRKAFLKWVVNA